MDELADRVALQVIFDMPSGPALERTWTWRQVKAGESPAWVHHGSRLLPWLREAEMEWEDPQGPVTIRGLVDEPYVALARAVLFAGADPLASFARSRATRTLDPS